MSGEPVPLKRTRSSAKSTEAESETPDPGKSGNGYRQKCRYWDKCFRKNADHRKQFRHPGDPAPKETKKTDKTSKREEEDMDTSEAKTTTTRTGRVSKPPTEFKYTTPPAHKNIPQVLLAQKWDEKK